MLSCPCGSQRHRGVRAMSEDQQLSLSGEKEGVVEWFGKTDEVETRVVNPIMKFFEYKHLPERLQAISKPIGEMAMSMNDILPDSPEKSAGLRKLLEAKDCMVRAELSK